MTLVSSSQISGLISQQQAQFYNGSLMAQQIAGQVPYPGQQQQTMMPPMMPASASGIAAGGITAAGGLATAGASMLGMGGAMRSSLGVTAGTALSKGMWGMQGLDPFSAAFAGARGGWALGGGGMAGGALGLAGGAMAAAPALAGYAAVRHVTKNIGMGMQEHNALGGTLNQNFQFSSGAAGGRGFDMSGVNQIEGMMRSLDKADPFTTFGELTRLVEKFNQSGMMAGVSNIQQFETRFKQALQTTKQVAAVMGTTVDEAAPFVADIRRSGFYTAQDITGQALNRQAADSYGFTGQQFTGIQRQGAALSQAFGSSRRSGAQLNTRVSQTIMQGMQMGVISDEDVMEATGGVGGAEGAAMLSGRMSQQALKFSTTSAGRAMMLATGEMKGGRYTGGVDKGQMQALKMGLIDVNNLTSTARGRMGGSRDAKVSFVANEERMRGEFARDFGPEMIHTLVSQVADKKGFMGESSDDVVNILMKRFTDLSRSEADIMVKIAKEYQTIEHERAMTMEREFDRAKNENERRLYHSWEGTKIRLKDTLDKAVMGPELRAAGGKLATEIDWMGQGIKDSLYGNYSGTVTQGAAENFMFGGAGGGVASGGGMSLGGSRQIVTKQGLVVDAGEGKQLYKRGTAAGGILGGRSRAGSLYEKSRGKTSGYFESSDAELLALERSEEAFSRGKVLDRDRVSKGASALGLEAMKGLYGSMSGDEYAALLEGGAGGVEAALWKTDAGQDFLTTSMRQGGSTEKQIQARAARGRGGVWQGLKRGASRMAMGAEGGGVGGFFGAHAADVGTLGIAGLARGARGFKEGYGGGMGDQRELAGLELESFMDTQAMLTQNEIAYGGVFGTGISEKQAALQQDAGISVLSQQMPAGMGTAFKAFMKDDKGRAAFQGMVGNVKNFSELKSKAKALSDARFRAASNRTTIDQELKAAGLSGFGDLSPSQLETLSKSMNAMVDSIGGKEGNAQDLAFQEFTGGVMALNVADQTLANLEFSNKYSDMGKALSDSLTGSGAKHLQDKGLKAEQAKMLEDFASRASDIRSTEDLDFLFGKGRGGGAGGEVGRMIAGLDTEAQMATLAYLSEQGGLGQRVADASMLYAGKGGYAKTVKRAGAGSRAGKTQYETLRALAAGTPLSYEQLQRELETGEHDIGKTMQDVFGEKRKGANVIEKAGFLTEAEEKRLMEELAPILMRAAEAGDVTGGVAGGSENTEIAEALASLLSAQGDYNEKTAAGIETVARATGIEPTESPSSGIDPGVTGAKSRAGSAVSGAQSAAGGAIRANSARTADALARKKLAGG